MKTAYIISLGAFATGALGQAGGAVFEDSAFNVTEALLDIGFNVSAIPELADLSERSSLKACSIAVSLSGSRCHAKAFPRRRNADNSLVYFAERCLRQCQSSLGELGILQCIHRRILVRATSRCEPSLCLQTIKSFGRLGTGSGVTSDSMSLRREIRWPHFVRWWVKYRRRHHGFHGKHEGYHGLR
jgi:hypothetical protein